MGGRVQKLAPLVDQLQRLCHGHLADDEGNAAAEMLADLRGTWAVLDVELRSDGEISTDLELLVLSVIRDVAELADILLEDEATDARLGWARANLIVDLENYHAASTG